MYCHNCGMDNRPGVRYCEDCGHQLSISPPPAAAPPPTQVVVQTGSSGGLFSSCTGIINLGMAFFALGAICVVVLVFLCVIRLPSSFPILNLPSQFDDLWGRAVALQSSQCGSSTTDEGSQFEQGGCPQGQVDCHGECCSQSKCIDICPCGMQWCKPVADCVLIGTCSQEYEPPLIEEGCTSDSECDYGKCINGVCKTLEPQPDTCSRDMSPDACAAAGGQYMHGFAEDWCACP